MSKDTSIIEKASSNEQFEDLISHKIDTPNMYKVVLFNDDYTTFEFVVYVLMKFFHKTQEEAENLTQEIHNTGKGVGGVFSYDEAETRKSLVTNLAKKNDFPLMCELEQA
jgi:ATP-dependent Clp protease adaptor protein ClpS